MENALLIISDAPWKLVFKIQLQQVSSHQILGVLYLDDSKVIGMTIEDLRELLITGRLYRLQLDPSFEDDGPIGLIQVRLQDWNPVQNQVHLSLRPLDSFAELELMVQRQELGN